MKCDVLDATCRLSMHGNISRAFEASRRMIEYTESPVGIAISFPAPTEGRMDG